MSDFSFLKKYVSESFDKGISMKHSFYPVKQSEIEEAEAKLGFLLPKELVSFYNTLGYGFFHNEHNYEFDRILSPLQVAQINLKEDFYQHDPSLEYYDYRLDKKLLFFEVIEGNYLAIDISDDQEKNSIYYSEFKIYDSLSEFVIELDKNPHLIEQIQSSL